MEQAQDTCTVLFSTQFLAQMYRRQLVTFQMQLIGILKTTSSRLILFSLLAAATAISTVISSPAVAQLLNNHARLPQGATRLQPPEWHRSPTGRAANST
jgi:hypothetical protein